jgi:hypothetical protein
MQEQAFHRQIGRLSTSRNGHLIDGAIAGDELFTGGKIDAVETGCESADTKRAGEFPSPPRRIARIFERVAVPRTTESSTIDARSSTTSGMMFSFMATA